jgi:hypothetical protein
MKSSHSGMPIFSPAVDVVVVVVVVVVALLELPAAVLLFSVVSVLLHPTKMAAHRTAKINKVLLNIWVLLQSSAETLEPLTGKGSKSGDMIHEKGEINSYALVGNVPPEAANCSFPDSLQFAMYWTRDV